MFGGNAALTKECVCGTRFMYITEGRARAACRGPWEAQGRCAGLAPQLRHLPYHHLCMTEGRCMMRMARMANRSDSLAIADPERCAAAM